jgi:uncharacterized repeat protein (TIGR01451 family)
MLGFTAQDSGSLNCTPPPQLTIVKSPKGGSFTPGGQATFTIVVSNAAGAGTARSVVLTDNLPGTGGLVWANASPTQGTCSISQAPVPNALTCNMGDIPAGGSVSVIGAYRRPAVPGERTSESFAQDSPIAAAAAENPASELTSKAARNSLN